MTTVQCANIFNSYTIQNRNGMIPLVLLYKEYITPKEKDFCIDSISKVRCMGFHPL